MYTTRDFHMTLQLEDVVDCLNVLCPEFDYLFLFDHSQGHARKRDGALDANKMSNNFGGSQPISQRYICRRTATIPGNSCKNSQQTTVSPFVSTRRKSSKVGRESPKAFSKSSGRGASLMKASPLIVTRSMAGKIRSRARSTANCRSGI